MKKKTSALSNFYIVLVFIFLYAPIAVMMLFSLNSTSSTYVFGGLTPFLFYFRNPFCFMNLI